MLSARAYTMSTQSRFGEDEEVREGGESPWFCTAALEISPPRESDEWGRVKSSGKCINKLSSPLFLCILFQVQLQVPPPVPVSSNAKPSRGAAVSLWDCVSHFRSFCEIHVSTFTFCMSPDVSHWCHTSPSSPRMSLLCLCEAARAPCASLFIGLSVAASFHHSNTTLTRTGGILPHFCSFSHRI